MDSLHILYVDFYEIACQWGASRCVYFKHPKDIVPWMYRAGFTTAHAYTIHGGRNSQRYVLAIDHSALSLLRMSQHVDRMLKAGGDDFATSLAYCCEQDVKRWAARGEVSRGTGDGAKRLRPRALEEIVQEGYGNGRWQE